MFFFKQKAAYEMLRSLVGSEMCIRDGGPNMLTPPRTAAPLMALSLWGCGGGGSLAGVPYPVDYLPPGETLGLDKRPADSGVLALALIHISEPPRLLSISHRWCSADI